MNDLLYRVFLENEIRLVNDVMQQLRNSTAHHYVELDWDRLLQRIQKLEAYFLISLRETPDRFVEYVGELARERIAEGYPLKEILMALRILEEKAWRVTVEEVPPAGQIAALARVTGTIGAAKDRLADAYVEHLERAEAEARGWRQRYEDLAAFGTVPQE